MIQVNFVEINHDCWVNVTEVERVWRHSNNKIYVTLTSGSIQETFFRSVTDGVTQLKKGQSPLRGPATRDARRSGAPAAPGTGGHGSSVVSHGVTTPPALQEDVVTGYHDATQTD